MRSADKTATPWPRRAIAALLVLSFPAALVDTHADDSGNDVEAQVETILALDADPAFGAYLGGECATCHRGSGASGQVPAIAGLDEEAFVRAVVEYRAGVRANEVMAATASRLGDEEIAALAAHFAAQ